MGKNGISSDHDAILFNLKKLLSANWRVAKIGSGQKSKNRYHKSIVLYGFKLQNYSELDIALTIIVDKKSFSLHLYLIGAPSEVSLSEMEYSIKKIEEKLKLIEKKIFKDLHKIYFEERLFDIKDLKFDKIKGFPITKKEEITVKTKLSTMDKELSNLIKEKIEIINQFENLIKNNSKEVPIIHNFLKSDPWLLDYNIKSFDDEITYSKILKEKFSESNIKLEENKRLDFLCIDFGDNFFIIELKRPEHKVNHKDLDQALEYISFINQNIGNIIKKRCHAYIICRGVINKPAVKEKAEAYRMANKVYIKTYGELLAKAYSHYRRFIETYNKFQK